MEKEQIISIVFEYVKSISTNDSTGHDWWHVKRVYNNALLINEKEKANEFVIKLIALLHDVYDHKFFDGDPSKELENLLKRLGVCEYIEDCDLRNIIYSCCNMGFSANMENKKELSLEGRIVQDADRLDGLGAIGIARTFAYGGKKGNLLYDPDNNKIIESEEEYKTNGSKTSISHFYDKLLKLKDLMNTDSAKLIAINRHKYLEEFLKEFLEEWDGKK